MSFCPNKYTGEMGHQTCEYDIPTSWNERILSDGERNKIEISCRNGQCNDGKGNKISIDKLLFPQSSQHTHQLNDTGLISYNLVGTESHIYETSKSDNAKSDSAIHKQIINLQQQLIALQSAILFQK